MKIFDRIRVFLYYREFIRTIEEYGKIAYPFMIRLNDKEFHRLPHTAGRFIEVLNGDEHVEGGKIPYVHNGDRYDIYYKPSADMTLWITVSPTYTDISLIGACGWEHVMTAYTGDTSLPSHIEKISKGLWLKDIIEFYYILLGI